MAASTLAKAAAGLTIFGTSSLAAFTWQQRHQNIATARRELEAERDELTQSIRELHNRTEAVQNSRVEYTAEAQDRKESLTTLWTDRLERYAIALDRSRDCLAALPEAVDALENARQHAQHMSEFMPQYLRFDMAASRTHAFGLLAASGLAEEAVDGLGVANLSRDDGRGLRQSRDVYAAVLHNDPVAAAVLQSVATLPAASDTIPSSIAELSAVFSRVRGSLDGSVNDYNRRQAELKQRRETAELMRRDEYLPFRPGTASHGIRSVAEHARLGGATNASEPAAAAMSVSGNPLESFTLKSRSDVLAALLHCDELQKVSKADGNGWTSDPQIALGLSNLAVWAKAAEEFLVEDQAARALKALHTVVQFPLVFVAKPPARDEGMPQ